MRWFFASIVVVSALVPADGAEAQERRPERPYRGLFGSGVSETEQLLTATASVGEGWDTSLFADALGRRSVRPNDVNRQFPGYRSAASAALAYSLNRARVGVGASAGTTAHYYPSLSHRFIRRDYGSIGTSANLGAGFSAQAAATYQPYTLRSMLPSLYEPGLGDSAIADEDFDENFPASIEHYFGYSAGADYTRRVTRRQTFLAKYQYRAREKSSTKSDRFEHHNAAAGITHVVGRGFDLRLGYGYSEARYQEGDRRFVNHTIDAGANYSRPLSFSRRTTLSLETGGSAARLSRHESLLKYRVTGAAGLDHEIGRTWNATFSYNRRLQFVETWPEPVFANSAAAGVGGLITRRSNFQVTATTLRGRTYFSAEGDGIQSYAAAARLTVAVTRSINTGLTYAYYHHQFGNGLLLPPGFGPDIERQSVRAFVSLWAPLFQRSARKP